MVASGACTAKFVASCVQLDPWGQFCPGQIGEVTRDSLPYRHDGDMRDGVWMAPGRVNLIGEHTDYNGGLCLPFAIGRRAVAEVSPAVEDSFASPYVEGVAVVLRQQGYDVPPVSVTFTSDVPIGAGLSSSAALTCVTALALNDLWELGLSRQQLVLVAQSAENDFVGAPTGILDQSASLLCTPGHALLLDCADRSTVQVPLDAGGLHFLVIDTGVSHAHADGGYARRRAECEAGDPRRWRHVDSENERVREVVELLGGGRVAEVGAVLTRSHTSLRDDFEVSWPEADAIVDVLTRNDSGALGARMIGGGFGGSVLVLSTDPDVTTDVVRRVLPAGEIFEVRSAGGAQCVSWGLPG